MTAPWVANMSKAFRVGIFIVLGLTLLSVGVFLIGDKDLLFTPTYTLKTDFQNVGGLDTGAEVRVGGIHEGTVSSIDLPTDPNGKVTVEMKLRNSTRNIIRKDSVVSIKTEGLLGNEFLEVSFGSQKAPPVQNNDVIAGAPLVDFADQAKSVTAEAKTGVEAFDQNMTALQHNFLLNGFFKKRGYNEPGELTENSIAKLPAVPSAREFDYDAEKLFKQRDGAQLKNQKQIDEAGDFLQDKKFGLAVVASSVATGDTPQDHLLTEARAKAVRDYLVQNFKLDDTRLKTIGLGKSKQAGDSGNVRILVYATAPAAPASSNEVTSSR
jgi:outer membrane protein OmpA-like peptidoglycan-associated protein